MTENSDTQHSTRTSIIWKQHETMSSRSTRSSNDNHYSLRSSPTKSTVDRSLRHTSKKKQSTAKKKTQTMTDRKGSNDGASETVSLYNNSIMLCLTNPYVDISSSNNRFSFIE